jgi:hypothetical protein
MIPEQLSQLTGLALDNGWLIPTRVGLFFIATLFRTAPSSQ